MVAFSTGAKKSLPSELRVTVVVGSQVIEEVYDEIF
jgi:hypothetical protein